MRRPEFVEDVTIIGGLIGVQFIYAGNSVLQKYLMSVGLPQSPFIISLNLVTFLILSPLAFFFERKAWPKRLSAKLSIQLVLISFAGVTLFQSLTLKGINLTSPSMATAMPNLAPGLVFLIAWAFRMEKVDLSCTHSRVKIVGTFLCVVGAVTMTIMQSTKKKSDAKDIFLGPLSPPTEHFYIFDKDRIIGCLYLIAAVIVLSSNVILQAMTLRDMPAPISLCAITSLIGVMLTVMVEFIQDHGIGKGWLAWSLKQLLCYAILTYQYAWIIPFLPLTVPMLIGLGLLIFPTATKSLRRMWSFQSVLLLSIVMIFSMNLSIQQINSSYVYQYAGIVSGVCVSFNGYAMKKRGPVLVSMFNPIGTVITVIISRFLGHSISIGSLTGMFVMFTGLYFVLWAKGKEGFLQTDENEIQSDQYCDVERPLLQ